MRTPGPIAEWAYTATLAGSPGSGRIPDAMLDRIWGDGGGSGGAGWRRWHRHRVDASRIIYQDKFCPDVATPRPAAAARESPGDSYRLRCPSMMTGLDRIGRLSLRQPWSILLKRQA